jgi:hypothetical protein
MLRGCVVPAAVVVAGAGLSAFMLAGAIADVQQLGGDRPSFAALFCDQAVVPLSRDNSTFAPSR